VTIGFEGIELTGLIASVSVQALPATVRRRGDSETAATASLGMIPIAPEVF